MSALDDMLAGYENRKVKGFWENAADRVLENYNSTSDNDVEQPLEQKLEAADIEARGERTASALFNFAKGAMQGASWVNREGNRLAAENPLALSGTPMGAGITNAPAPAENSTQKEARENYGIATGAFAEETIKPVALAAALFGPEAIAAPIMAPMALEALKRHTSENGVSGVFGAAKELVTPAAVALATDDNAQQEASNNPSAFAVDFLGSVGMDVAGLAGAKKGAGVEAPKDIMKTLRRQANVDLSPIEAKAAATAQKIIAQNVEANASKNVNTMQAMGAMDVAENKLTSLSEQIASANSSNNKQGFNDLVKNWDKAYKAYVEDVAGAQQAGEKVNTANVAAMRLVNDEIHFSQAVDNLAANGKKGENIRVLESSDSFGLRGAGDIMPIEIKADTISAIVKDSPIGLEAVKQLPKALSKPLAIITHVTDDNVSHNIFILGLEVGGKAVLAPVELHEKLNHYEVVPYTSKMNGAELVKNAAENGMLHYADDTKLASAGVDIFGDKPTAANNAKSAGVQYSFGQGPIKAKALENAKPVSRKEIEKAVNDIVPVRIGGVEGKQYTGLFKVAPEVVRAKGFGDYATYAHEIGHYIDKTLKLVGFDDELISAADKLWGNIAEYTAMDKNAKRAEGVAEFFREALYNPDEAKKNFPGYYDAVVKALSQEENKGLAAKIDKLSELLQRYENSTDQAKANAAISYKDDKSLKSIGERLKDFANRVYTAGVDKLQAVNALVNEAVKLKEESLPFAEDPYKLMRCVDNNIQGRASLMLTDKGKAADIIGTLNQLYNGMLQHEVTFQDILKDINSVDIPKEILEKHGYKDKRQALSVYLAAQHIIEISSVKKDYKPPFSVEIAKKVVAEAPPEFSAIASKVYDFLDNALAIYEDAGMVTKEQRKALREKYPHYVPFDRDVKLDDFKAGGAGKAGGITNQKNAIKQLTDTGGTWNVMDPLDGAAAYMQQAINQSARNKVGQSLVKLADIEGIGRLIEERPELEGKQAADENVFTVWENGKKKSYQTTPEIYQAVTSYNQPMFDTFITLVPRIAADIMRTGATSTPAFGLYNAVRDTFSAPLFSKNNFIPILDSIRGLYWLKTDKQAAMEYKAAGVAIGTRVRADRATLKWDALKNSAIGIPINKALEMGQAFNELMETAARFGEFYKARKAGKDIMQAGYEATDLMDFGRSGSAGKQINKVVPFFNAVIQSTDKVIRAAKDNPVRFAGVVTSYIVMPALIEWLSFHDEDWYNDTLREFKDNYVFMKLPFGDTQNIVRYPVPQEMAAINGGVKRALSRLLDNDRDAMQGWAANMAENIAPDVTPALLRPYLEWTSGYNWFTGRNVVSQKLQSLPPELQYDLYSSMLSIRLGELAGVSPKKIDNLISNIGATAARETVSLLDTPLGRENELPAKNINEFPVIGRFGYTPGKHSQALDDFYNDYNKTAEQYKGYGSKGKNVANWEQLKAAYKQISNLNKEANNVKNNIRLNARQKREQIDRIEAKMIKIAKNAHSRYAFRE